VAVLVDSTIADRLGSNEAERISKIKGIVAAASGLKNGAAALIDDSVSVAFIEFYSEQPETAETAPPVIRYLPYISAGAALLVLALVMLLVSGRRKKERRRLQQQAIDAERAQAAIAFDQTVGEEIPMTTVREIELTPEEIEYNRIREEVETFIQNNPEAAVQVVKTWLLEDQR
jgi:flagellar biosynthesis/type III secretory pathway M-ring protein FliF/YscJ